MTREMARRLGFSPLLSPPLLSALSFIAAGCAAGAQSEPKTTADAKDAPQSVASLSQAESECLENAEAPRAVPPGAPDRISVAHILVRHNQLERPLGATRTRGQACLHALSALEALQAGEEWNAVVDEYSDSEKSTHGRLGRLSRDDVTPAFRDAAFSLEPNQLSYVVETDRGFHIILRED